jgi:hypothetical protein
MLTLELASVLCPQTHDGFIIILHHETEGDLYQVRAQHVTNQNVDLQTCQCQLQVHVSCLCWENVVQRYKLTAKVCKSRVLCFELIYILEHIRNGGKH